MKPIATQPPNSDSALALVRGELSNGRRWAYRVLLVATTVWVAFIGSVWATEPERLPVRLHVAFGVITLIGAAWSGTFLWILTRRHCPTALDQIATGWMATVASTAFTVVGLVVAWVRSGPMAMTLVATTGLTFVALATSVLYHAYRTRADLQRQLSETTK